MKKKGAVLIIALWILSMLVLLAISIGRRTSIELRLLKYHLSRSQAFHLARAAIERIYAEKNMDEAGGYDTLNEDWSNKLKADGEPLFKDFPLGNGTFTLKYNQADTDYYGGMQDESSKLNINKILDNDSKPIDARKKEFQNLIENILGSSEAETMVNNFIDWIDNIANHTETFSSGEIQAKNAPLDRLEELTMIDGFSIEDVKTLSDYITVYGEGKININTAPQEVLTAIGLDECADTIISYRNGKDGQGATNDDQPIKDINSELTNGGAVFPKNELSSNEITDLNNVKSILTTSSSFYKANSSAKVNEVKKEISAVINFTENKQPQYLYWYED